MAVLPFGCYATASGYTEADFVQAEVAPAHVEVYPRYEYEGRTVYLVSGHWYSRRGPHWVYYRSEPPELQRRRVYVERAPRAAERRGSRHQHPARPVEHRDRHGGP